MGVPAREHLRRVISERRTSVLSCTARLVSQHDLGNGFVRVRLQGDGLAQYRDALPADAFKVHLPGAPGAPVPCPEYDARGRLVWPDGPRPLARCFTVRHANPDDAWIEFDALLHTGGATERWIREAALGDQVSLTGWRTEFVDSPEAEHHLLIGDRSAEPAIEDIVASLPDGASTVVALDALEDPAEALRACTVTDSTQVWVGAEAGIARQVRRFLLGERGVDPDALHASAYWKRDQEWESMFDDQLDRVLAAAAAGEDVGDPAVLQRLALDS